MTPEQETRVLLSGAAVNVEEVARVRDDLSGSEKAELGELVSDLKDLHERLGYESSFLDVQPRTDVPGAVPVEE